MIVLTATWEIRPEDSALIFRDLEEMVEAIRTNEPGCITYQLHRNLENPGQLLLYEVYRDQASLDFHMNTPHFKEIVLGRIVPRLIGRDRSLWEPIG